MEGIISKIIFYGDYRDYMIITDKNGQEMKIKKFISWHWITSDPKLKLNPVSLSMLKKEVKINKKTKSIYLKEVIEMW